MHTLPQLIEEDIREFDTVLSWVLGKSQAIAAVIADKAGFLIAHKGGENDLDLTTIAALAAGAFMATQTVASLIRETEFDSTFQQGRQSGLFIQMIDDNSLLLVIYPPAVGVGRVKYFARDATCRIARQMQVAHSRDPGAGLDLAVLNLEDPSAVFKRRPS